MTQMGVVAHDARPNWDAKDSWIKLWVLPPWTKITTWWLSIEPNNCNVSEAKWFDYEWKLIWAWVGLWVSGGWVYMKGVLLSAIIIINDEKENLRGAFVAAVELLIAIEAKAVLVPWSQFLWWKSFERHKWVKLRRSGQQWRRGRHRVDPTM